MREAATQRDIRYFGIGQALQQFAARGLKSDITKRRPGRLTEKNPELPLQGSAGYARDVRQLGHAPVAPDICAHRIERAADATRQQRFARGAVGACIHGKLTPTI